MEFLNRWYREMLHDSTLSPAFIRDVRFIDVADVEQLSEARARGLSWNELLLRKSKRAYAEMSIFRFLIAEDVLRDKSRVLQRFITEAVESFEQWAAQGGQQ
jgi:hypothetical protein